MRGAQPYSGGDPFVGHRVLPYNHRPRKPSEKSKKRLNENNKTGGIENGSYMFCVRSNVRRLGRYGDYVFGAGGERK